MSSQVYDQDRISKISKIMPQFNKVANVGDKVLMGLEGDPSFPFSTGSRPEGTIVSIDKKKDGTEIQFHMNDGSNKTVNEYSIAPGDVWEYSDESFSKVMEREREAQEMRMARAEKKVTVPSTTYRGDENSLMQEIKQLRSDLNAERELTRNFHNTYIASLHELAQDVCRLDTDGKHANFCRTFNSEYEKMQSRAETTMYRGTKSKYDDDEDEEEEDEEELFSESDAKSLSDGQAMDESDYF